MAVKTLRREEYVERSFSPTHSFLGSDGKTTRKGTDIRDQEPKEEFRRIWLSEHAPLVHAVPQVRRYVLSFILEEPTRPDVATQAMNVDAVAELWYDDMATLKAAAASPQMKAVTDNGALHLGAIKSFITEEVAIIL